MYQGTVSGGVTMGAAASFERPIDLVHLARQTLGDRSLEQEILTLYLRQAQALMDRIDQAADKARCDLAHTLKGSSRAVGAWQVASAAEAVEIVAPGDDRDLQQALVALRKCVVAACDTIYELQRGH